MTIVNKSCERMKLTGLFRLLKKKVKHRRKSRETKKVEKTIIKIYAQKQILKNRNKFLLINNNFE